MKHATNADTLLTNVKPEDVQPNAIDLRVEKVFTIDKNSPFFLSESNEKVHRGGTEIQPDEEGFFNFEEAGDYEVIMENKIYVGDTEAGWVITRSTLNRNGIFLTSGLYDSGYKGVMAAVLHVNGPAQIQKGSRIGQYLCFDAEAVATYDGSYGEGKEHDKKYEE